MKYAKKLLFLCFSIPSSVFADTSANTTINGSINFVEEITTNISSISLSNILSDQVISENQTTNLTKDPDKVVICYLSATDLSGNTLTLANGSMDTIELNLAIDNTNICTNISLTGIIDTNAEFGTSYSTSGSITFHISYQ